MRITTLALAVAAIVITQPAPAQSTLDFPVGERLDLNRDSGPLDNAALVSRAVYRDIVVVPEAAWLRLYFGEVRLEADSFVRITSLLDNEVQELDAHDIRMWGHSSAYFNGNVVLVELVAGPDTRANRVEILQVDQETAVALPIGFCGICSGDDRVPTTEDFAPRLLPAGCSSTVYSTESCLVTAGHCIDDTGNTDVIEFRVPLSDPDCDLNHPPIEDQFPIVAKDFSNGGVGNDWGVMVAGTNNLGETPFERYGALLPIATSAAPNGGLADVWGYGVDTQCVNNQVQQNSDGNINGVQSDHYTHDVDTTFGNSGSNFTFNGEIVGIATHCTCPFNIAQRVDLPSFVAARDAICPEATDFCDDIDRFRARCNHNGNDRLQAVVRFIDESHDGETVVFDVDGVEHARVVVGNRARLNLSGFGGTGDRTVSVPACGLSETVSSD